MGQAATKQHHHGHDGSAASHHSSSSQSPSYPPSVDGGALVPQGVYTGPQDYSHDVVKTAIVKRKLMPFYKGVDDEDSYSGRTHVSECPICFLYYPSTLNRTRCCAQPICTECFVQIKRADPNHTNPPSSQPAECPFCTAENFGVVYTRPPRVDVTAGTSSEGSAVAVSESTSPTDESTPTIPPLSAKRKSFSHTDPEVLTTDMVRPDWQSKLATAQAAILRRANRRIIMRQVGDRLIPIGISSSRIGAELPEGTGPGGAIILREGENWGPFSGDDVPGGSGRRGSRRGQSQFQMAGADVEEMMMMEAMRLSLIEHEEQQRRQSSAADAARASQAQAPGEGTSTSTEPIRTAALPNNSSNNREGGSDLSRSGSGLGRSSSTSRGQPMSPPSKRAQRLSRDMREATPAGDMPSGSGPSPLAATSSGSANQSNRVSEPALDFGLRADVMSELAELIDEPNEEMRQRIEAARRAREAQSTAAESKRAAVQLSTADQSSMGSIPAPTPSSSAMPPLPVSPRGSARPLNPNNPFRNRMASSDAEAPGASR